MDDDWLKPHDETAHVGSDIALLICIALFLAIAIGIVPIQ